MKVIELIRDVTPDECFWLYRIYRKGERLCISEVCDYGCTSSAGISCTELSDPQIGPFFEIPKDALNIAKLLKEMDDNSLLFSRKITVIKDVFKDDYPNAFRDFKCGEKLYFNPDFDTNRIPNNCIPVSENRDDTFYFELPNHAVRTILDF